MKVTTVSHFRTLSCGEQKEKQVTEGDLLRGGSQPVSHISLVGKHNSSVQLSFS